jgi:hypothetical protein
MFASPIGAVYIVNIYQDPQRNLITTFPAAVIWIYLKLVKVCRRRPEDNRHQKRAESNSLHLDCLDLRTS